MKFPSVAKKSFASSSLLKKLMDGYFTELNTAVINGYPPIAWCTSVGPAELLRSMGFLVFFPENHAAMLGASRRAGEYIPEAHGVGFSPDVCSYLTSDIGAWIKQETPLALRFPFIKTAPRPNILVYSTNQCRDVKDWFSWYSRTLNVPCIGIDSFSSLDEVTEAQVNYIAGQIKALIPVLTAVSGNAFDMERLQEIIRLSRECSDLWKMVLDTAACRPSPLTFFDGTVQMGPAVVLRGTIEAVNYYSALLAELKQRVSQGISAVDDEQYRIYWEGMPVWGALRELSVITAGLNACITASTYCNSWIFSALDPAQPFNSMARAYTELFIVRSDAVKEDYIKRQLDFFSIDGIIFHEARTCPRNSNTRYGMPLRLSADHGIPSLIINGDLNDLRLFSREQTATRIEAFIERLKNYSMSMRSGA